MTKHLNGVQRNKEGFDGMGAGVFSRRALEMEGTRYKVRVNTAFDHDKKTGHRTYSCYEQLLSRARGAHDGRLHPSFLTRATAKAAQVTGAPTQCRGLKRWRKQRCL